MEQPRASHPAAILAVVTVATALLLSGSPHAWQQAVVLALMALGLLLARRSPEARNLPVRLLTILSLIASSILVGLLPLPAAVLEVVAPGIAAARPGSWSTLALLPGAVVDEASLWVLLVGQVALVSLWSRNRRRRAGDAAVFMGGGLAVFALAHGLLGARAVLGLLPVQDPPDLFLAPLVDPDHLAFALLLVWPPILDRAIHATHREPRTAARISLALVAVTFLLTRSGGGLLALTLQILVFARDLAPRHTLRLRLGGVVVAVVSAVALLLLDPTRITDSVLPRLQQYQDLLPLFRDHWLAGTGAGSYLLAQEPYRSGPLFTRLTHVHSDLLEYVVETGIIGVLIAGIALYLRPRASSHRHAWRVGVAGGIVHALVEFPLQLPGLLLLFGSALAVMHPTHRDTLRPVARRWLLTLAVLSLVGALWQTRRAALRWAGDTVAEHPTATSLAVLDRLGPWTAPAHLGHAWLAESLRDRDEATAQARAVVRGQPHDADALRQAALVLARAHQWDEALAALERATERAPNDYRTWAVTSRVLRASGGPGDEAAETWAEALRHWPYADREADPVSEALDILPVALWWLEATEDAPAWISYELARTSLVRGEPEITLLACEQAARLRPRAYGRCLFRSSALVELGMFDQAMLELQTLLAAEPDHALAWDHLASLHHRQRDHDAAADAWAHAWELEPTAERGRLAVSALLEAGDPASARRLAEHMLLRTPYEPDLHMLVAEALAQEGNPVACRETIYDHHLDEHPRHRARATELLRTTCAPPGLFEVELDPGEDP